MKDLKYTIDVEASVPVMLINDVIGEEVLGGDFQRELLYLDTLGKDAIEIYINSPGGSVFDGFSIASAILNAKTPIITNNIGIAGSIAGVIFMCGKQRIMADYALFMMHNVSGPNAKAKSDLNNSISLLLSKNSSLSQDQVLKLMNIETWMNYEECAKNGFSTKNNIPILEEDVFNIKNKAYDEIFDYANKIILNMSKENIEETELIIENSDLIVNQGVIETEVTIRTEVDSDLELEVVENTHADIVEEIEELNKVDEKDILIEELKNQITKLKEKEIEKEIESFLNNSIDLGRISSETKGQWLNMCKIDFDNSKEIIKTLNINKSAPTFENTITEIKTPKTFLDMFNLSKNK